MYYVNFCIYHLSMEVAYARWNA